MEDDERFVTTNEKTHVHAVNPVGEVGEIEMMRLQDNLKDPTTIGVFAYVVQRPVAEIPERLKTHQHFVCLEIDALTLYALTERALAQQAESIATLLEGEEDDDGV